ncbi:MAG: diguanylate cyclase/phosphodiesterase domain [Rhizorhabdus sp.]|nr:diguanylate cyclase/phosphodiesterase domain [Rhizorhabdus sp.]
MTRLWVAAATAALLGLSGGAAAKDEPAPAPKIPAAQRAEDEAVLKAALHISQRRFDDALAVLDPMIAAHDAQAAGEKRRIFSARSLAETMEYMLGAANNHEDSVVMSYTWGNALYLKGFVLIELQRVDEAKLFLERAVTLSPNNAKFLGELGEWYKTRGRLDEAEAMFKRAEIVSGFSPDELKLPEKTRAMRGVAWVAVERGRLDEADAIYRECLALNPDDQMAKSERAYIAQQRLKSMR